jgi:hypothetical protein
MQLEGLQPVGGWGFGQAASSSRAAMGRIGA